MRELLSILAVLAVLTLSACSSGTGEDAATLEVAPTTTAGDGVNTETSPPDSIAPSPDGRHDGGTAFHYDDHHLAFRQTGMARYPAPSPPAR